jgi:hypothetical protein
LELVITIHASNSYTLDRFVSNSSPFNGGAAVKILMVLQVQPSGFTKYLGFQTLFQLPWSAGSYYGLAQAIEGYNVADFGWGTANAVPALLYPFGFIPL